jgi:hypothetical protein
MLVGHNEADKQDPQIVGQQQQSGRQFSGGAGLGTKATEAPLVLQFIKDVSRIGSIAVELHKLPRVLLLHGQVRHVHRELVFAELPELAVITRRHRALQAASEDHATSGAPTAKVS